MKKLTLFITLLFLTIAYTDAQAQSSETTEAQEPDNAIMVPKNTLTLGINTMTPDQASQIKDFITKHNGRRGFGLTLGTALLGTAANCTSNIIIDEIIKATQIRKNQKIEWEQMIGNECRYVDSLSYVNNLTDFYSEGSFNGALDPADLNFNGFTLNAQRDGQDVLLFYCHVDTEDEGLSEIYNHSKFRLVLDSMYFYPYRCHLPNFTANQIFLEEGKSYGRCSHFSFEERNNLMVDLNFTITSSWYNQAAMLAKDVELGEFSIQIPIEKDRLTDNVFVYKREIDTLEPLAINGDCFIVPRSFMPLPGGVAHWGTGEYNVKVTVSEQCNISPELREHWKKDYRCLRRMKKENKVKDYFINVYQQNGTTVMRRLLESASTTSLKEVGL